MTILCIILPGIKKLVEKKKERAGIELEGDTNTYKEENVKVNSEGREVKKKQFWNAL